MKDRKDNLPTVFIVDNEVEICQLLKDFFDFIGYSSSFETDGRKVLEEIGTYEYDLLFVDLRLDTISGIDILKKSREVHPLAEVIIITGYGSEETILETFRNGAFTYIQKPISFSEIRIQTEEAIARQRFNRRTVDLRAALEKSGDRALVKHLQDMVHLERLSIFLNLTIDLTILSDMILEGIANLLPGKQYSFLFVDDINKEMAIRASEPLDPTTVNRFELDIRTYFEKLASLPLGEHYNVKVDMPTNTGARPLAREPFEHVFVPILIENTIHGMLGVSDATIDQEDYIRDMLYIVSSRTSDVLTNATLHRNTKLLALTDGLTGLLNRSAFHDRLESEYQRFKRYGSHLSLIVADMDNLKQVNDSYGHPVGDEVIRKIGDVLRETTRESDVLTRYGGDEFVIVLPQTNTQNASNLAERIRRKIEEHSFSVDGKPFRCTLSLGVATAPAKAINSSEDLLECADQALYESKRAGRNRVSIACLK